MNYGLWCYSIKGFGAMKTQAFGVICLILAVVMISLGGIDSIGRIVSEAEAKTLTGGKATCQGKRNTRIRYCNTDNSKCPYNPTGDTIISDPNPDRNENKSPDCTYMESGLQKVCSSMSNSVLCNP